MEETTESSTALEYLIGRILRDRGYDNWPATPELFQECVKEIAEHVESFYERKS